MPKSLNLLIIWVYCNHDFHVNQKSLNYYFLLIWDCWGQPPPPPSCPPTPRRPPIWPRPLLTEQLIQLNCFKLLHLLLLLCSSKSNKVNKKTNCSFVWLFKVFLQHSPSFLTVNEKTDQVHRFVMRARSTCCRRPPLTLHLQSCTVWTSDYSAPCTVACFVDNLP